MTKKVLSAVVELLKEADQKIILAIKEGNMVKALVALAMMEIARNKISVETKQLGKRVP